MGLPAGVVGTAAGLIGAGIGGDEYIPREPNSVATRIPQDSLCHAN